MLEHSVSLYDARDPDPKGWFLQLSGFFLFLLKSKQLRQECLYRKSSFKVHFLIMQQRNVAQDKHVFFIRRPIYLNES